jgi:20S proteasome alpha/beta subunit
MTLIAGFRSVDGVVLCADSRESDGITKDEVDKLVEYRRDWCTVGFAGAGNDGDIIDATIEQITDALDDEKPKTIEAVKRVIRNALSVLPMTENAADLLLAVCPSHNPKAELWAVVDRHLRSVASGHAVMGVGRVVRFVAERLYRPDLSLYQTVLLAVHLLNIAKRYVADVEGTSHVLVLTDGGWLARERVDEVTAREQVFEWLDAALSHVYLSFADTSITKEQFEDTLEKFNTTIKTLRANHFEEFKDAHLKMAISDPSYAGDPYRTLPDDARSQFGPMAVHYHFEETPTGTSGWASPSPTPPESEFDESQEPED